MVKDHDGGLDCPPCGGTSRKKRQLGLELIASPRLLARYQYQHEQNDVKTGGLSLSASPKRMGLMLMMAGAAISMPKIQLLTQSAGGGVEMVPQSKGKSIEEEDEAEEVGGPRSRAPKEDDGKDDDDDDDDSYSVLKDDEENDSSSSDSDSTGLAPDLDKDGDISYEGEEFSIDMPE